MNRLVERFSSRWYSFLSMFHRLYLWLHQLPAVLCLLPCVALEKKWTKIINFFVSNSIAVFTCSSARSPRFHKKNDKKSSKTKDLFVQQTNEKEKKNWIKQNTNTSIIVWKMRWKGVKKNCVPPDKKKSNKTVTQQNIMKCRFEIDALYEIFRNAIKLLAMQRALANALFNVCDNLCI